MKGSNGWGPNANSAEKNHGSGVFGSNRGVWANPQEGEACWSTQGNGGPDWGKTKQVDDAEANKTEKAGSNNSAPPAMNNNVGPEMPGGWPAEADPKANDAVPEWGDLTAAACTNGQV